MRHPFVEQMWTRYSEDLPVPADGHQDPAAATTWK